MLHLRSVFAGRMPLCLVWIFLRMKPKVRVAFVVTFCICWFQFRSWPISSPRYFAWSTASKTWPCRTYWVWRGLRARVICRTWHLLGLKCIYHVFHFSRFWRSCCRVWESSLLVTVKYTAVSSAKSLTCEFMFSGRSFMFRRNKIGRRTEPWGTREVMSSGTRYFAPTMSKGVYYCIIPTLLVIVHVSSNLIGCRKSFTLR